MVRGEGDPARAARLSWAWVGWKDEGEGEDSEGAMLGWAGLGWRSGGRERVGSAAGVTDRRSIGWISKDWGWGSASGAEIQPSSLKRGIKEG